MKVKQNFQKTSVWKNCAMTNLQREMVYNGLETGKKQINLVEVYNTQKDGAGKETDNVMGPKPKS